MTLGIRKERNYRKVNLPSRNEYYDFVKFITSNETVSPNERTRYSNAIKKYNSVDDFLNNGTSIFSRLIVFVSLKYNQKVSDSLMGMNIKNTERVASYFNLHNQRFFSICNERLKGSSGGWHNAFFYNLLVKTFMFLGESNVDNIGYDDLKTLYCDAFLSSHVHARPFINFFATIVGEYNGKALPYVFSSYFKNRDEYELYGTNNIELQAILNKYLKEEYTSKGVPVVHPLKGLKTFATWLYENRPEITNVNSIKREDWIKFQEYVFETYDKNSTRRHKLHTILKFLKWLQHKNYVANIVGFSVASHLK